MGEFTTDDDLAGFAAIPITPIRAGKYEVRLAKTDAEVRAAQKLRYQVMYEERGGHPDLEKIRLELDVDEWDQQAFHIIVTDTSAEVLKVMGTLRLVSNLRLNEKQKFYTEAAFDLSRLRNVYSSILELGRFCIHSEGRQGAILMLIWKFAMQFIIENEVQVMIGCASFPGVEIGKHKEVLGYLYRHNLASASLLPVPIVPNHVRLSEIAPTDIGFESATRSIPTLLRGYLKLGARVSDTAIIDPIFNSTFLCIYVDARNMLAESTVLVSRKKPSL